MICEAMAYGKPVLASAVSDNPRIVEDGVSGFLFDTSSPDAIAPTSELSLRQGVSETLMLKVVIINAVYPPEPVVSAQIGQDLAMHLVEDGARVTVLCPFPTRPVGADYADYRAAGCPRVDSENGVVVVRLPSFTAPKSKLLPRMRESYSFGRHVCGYLEDCLADADVVYANVWAMLSQSLIAKYCNRRGIPLILHIQDTYPESLFGKLPGFGRRLWASPLTELDRRTVRQATRVVVISDNMRRTYVEHRGLAPEKVVMIPNWMDEARFASLPLRAQACAQYGLPEERFTFLYLGNIGPVAGVQGLIETFHAAGLKQAQLVIAGDGSSRDACVQLATRLKASSVRFISDPDVGNVPMIQSLAHVCMLPLRKGTSMSSVPSKLVAYLLSAKPVIASVEAGSDTGRCVREAQCGWVGEPEEAQWLSAKMTEVVAMSAATLNEMGQRGLAYGLKHFSKAEGVRRLADVVLMGAKTETV